MLRKLIGFVLGMLAGVLMVAMIEAVGHKLFPPPPGLNVKDPEQLKALMSQLPIGALISVVVGWIGGALSGGQIAMLVARDLRVSLAVGFCLTMAGVLTMLEIPHPLWMWVVGVLTPIPAAWLGARIAGGSAPAPPRAPA